MADKCQELLNAVIKTDNAQRDIKAAKGETKINKIMNPLRELKTKIDTLPDGTQRTIAKQDLARHYSEAGTTKPSSAERNEITNDLLTDPDVKEYLKSMEYNNYANLRAEIQGTFGGEQARIAEIKFREAKIEDMTPRLQQQGLYTQTIQDALGTIKGEGAINQRNFEMMRGLDDISKNGLDAIQTGTARQTYDKMVSQMQKPITNDIFATAIEKNFDKLILDVNDSNITAKMFRKLPTNDELKMFDDIKTGKRAPDGSAFEASMRMLDKINADGWTTIRGVIKPLDELKAADKGAIAKELVNRWSVKRIATSPKTVAATAVAIVIGFPAYVSVTGMWQQTQFENNMQFGKWVDDKTSNGMWNRFLSDDAKTAQQLAKTSQQAWLDMYDYMGSIPIIGDWYKFVVDTVGTYAMIKGFDNDASLNIFGPLVDKGLAVADPSTPWGFRRSTPDEMKQLYENDPGKLFLNDIAWQDKNTPWTEKTNIFTKTGKELTPTQAMKLYYAENDKYGASGSFEDLQDESTMKAVREYGKLHDTAGQTQQTTTTSTTTQKTKTTYNQEQIAYLKSIGLDSGQIKTREDRGDIIAKDATGKWTMIRGDGKTPEMETFGGGGGGESSGGGSDERKEDGRQKQLQDQLKKGERTLDTETLRTFKKEGKVDIKKLTEKGGSITDAAKIDPSGTKTGFKDYAKTMKQEGKIDKEKYEEMKNVDEAETKKALTDAFRCDV